MNRTVLMLTSILPALTGGCVGSGYTAFFTNENLGINIDSGPSPTASISVDRTEGVITPSFEDGHTSAVLASSSHDIPTILPLSWKRASVFAGGAAAAYASGSDAPPAAGQPPGGQAPHHRVGAACVSENPLGWDNQRLPGAGHSKPLIFLTTTSTGFRLSIPATAVSGASFPDVHLGYKRKEVAFAPLQIAGKMDCDTEGGTTATNGYRVNSPSFLAISRNGAESGAALKDGQFSIGSVFATGVAANNTARTDGVRGSITDSVTAKTKPVSP